MLLPMSANRSQAALMMIAFVALSEIMWSANADACFKVNNKRYVLDCIGDQEDAIMNNLKDSAGAYDVGNPNKDGDYTGCCFMGICFCLFQYCDAFATDAMSFCTTEFLKSAVCKLKYAGSAKEVSEQVTSIVSDKCYPVNGSGDVMALIGLSVAALCVLSCFVNLIKACSKTCWNEQSPTPHRLLGQGLLTGHEENYGAVTTNNNDNINVVVTSDTKDSTRLRESLQAVIGEMDEAINALAAKDKGTTFFQGRNTGQSKESSDEPKPSAPALKGPE